MDSDVQFEEEDLLTVARPTSSKKKKNGSMFTRIAISTGMAKDEKDAQKVMLIVAVCLIVFAVGFYVFGNNVVQSPAPTQDQLQADLNHGG